MSKQKNDDVPSQWKTLVLDYLENTMTDEQFQELRLLIEKPGFQRLLADYAIDQSVLRELTKSEELVEGLNLPHRPRQSTSPLSTSPLSENHADTNPAATKWISGRVAIFAAISAMLLAMATAILSPQSQSTLVADASSIQIQSAEGGVSVEGQVAGAGMLLQEGQIICTEGITSFARISYDDGTAVVLAGNSAIVCTSENGQKFIRVKRGNVSASVSPQPTGKPLLFITDTARMEVVGTNLAISASQSTTRLDVTEGKVKIQERSLGNQADVSAGNYAVANIGENISVSPQSLIPNTWKIDFEKGLPLGWQQGNWEQNKQGEDSESNYSLGAVKQTASPDTGFYAITSPNLWSEGQFRVGRNAHLQFRVKMEKPEWYQVLLVIRDGGFRSSGFRCGVYEYQEPNTMEGAMKHLPPNQWRTIRVPLSSFTRTNPRKYPSIETPFDQRPSDPPAIDDVVYTVIFSSQSEDRGLVIDDISVTVE